MNCGDASLHETLLWKTSFTDAALEISTKAIENLQSLKRQLSDQIERNNQRKRRKSKNDDNQQGCDVWVVLKMSSQASWWVQ